VWYASTRGGDKYADGARQLAPGAPPPGASVNALATAEPSSSSSSFWPVAAFGAGALGALAWLVWPPAAT
jgi:hypothetical protein